LLVLAPISLFANPSALYNPNPDGAVLLIAAEPQADPTSKSTKTAERPASQPDKAGPGASKPAAGIEAEKGWVSLFDGKTLKGWKVTEFAGHNEVRVDNGQIILEMGDYMTGITWTNDLPRMNYELSMEAMRVDGSDFFCGLTFPVNKDPCSLIIGGWGGGLVGLSSIDGNDASSNETTSFMSFETGRWYRVRLRVTPSKIEAWIDKKKVVDLETEGKQLSIRIEVELSKPLGIATYLTKGAMRDIKMLRLEPETKPVKPPAPK
jgi:hypothetical protein